MIKIYTDSDRPKEYAEAYIHLFVLKEKSSYRSYQLIFKVDYTQYPDGYTAFNND